MRSKTVFIMVAFAAIFAGSLPYLLRAIRFSGGERALLREAESHITILDREIDVFHFVARPKELTGYVVPTDQKLGGDWVNGRIIATTLNPDYKPTVRPKRDWLGEGLYASNDPVSSLHFSQPNYLDTEDPSLKHPWMLHRVRLQRGSRILDISSVSEFPDTLKAYLSGRFGCEAINLAELLVRDTEDKLRCREPARNLLSKERIDAVGYAVWYGAAIPESVCPKFVHYAFLLTSPVRPENIAVFTAVLPLEGHDAMSGERQMITQLYRAVNNPEFPLLWPSLEEPRSSEFLEWAGRLFKCRG